MSLNERALESLTIGSPPAELTTEDKEFERTGNTLFSTSVFHAFNLTMLPSYNTSLNMPDPLLIVIMLKRSLLVNDNEDTSWDL